MRAHSLGRCKPFLLVSWMSDANCKVLSLASVYPVTPPVPLISCIIIIIFYFNPLDNHSHTDTLYLILLYFLFRFTPTPSQITNTTILGFCQRCFQKSSDAPVTPSYPRRRVRLQPAAHSREISKHLENN